MTDNLSTRERSKLMGRIGSNGNQSTEIRLIKIMRRFRITGWRRGSKLPGKPDFAFPVAKVAVFVDGDFWHGHPLKRRVPKTNTEYWRKKISGNVARDAEVNQILEEMGWTVFRIWESMLSDEEAVVAKLRLLLSSSPQID